MTDTATVAKPAETKVRITKRMQEVPADDRMRTAELHEQLMSHKILAFVIRASLGKEELARVQQAIWGGDRVSLLFSQELAALHEDVRRHVEAQSGHQYQSLRPYDGNDTTYLGQPMVGAHVNRKKKGAGEGRHLDTSPRFAPEDPDTPPEVLVHTVVDGNVDVAAANFNYRTDPTTGEPVDGIADLLDHKAALGPGDSVVFRQTGIKPTEHDFTSPDGGDRTSAIQNVSPV